MLSKKSFGIAGAAMLGTAALLGTNAANAVIMLDAEDKSGRVTYAKETLLNSSDRTVTVDDETYYVVDGGDDALDVSAMVGIGGTTGSNLIIRFDFENMVMTDDSDPMLTVATATGGSPQDATLRSGGEGMAHVTFIVERIDAIESGDSIATLTLEELAVSADANGSITMMVSDDLPLPDVHPAKYPNAVGVAPAIDEMAVPRKPVALVKDEFMSFGDPGTAPADAAARDLIESVGSFMVVAKENHLNANDGEVSEVTDLIAEGTATVDTATDETSSVTVSGKFGFASAVTWDSTPECSPTAADADNLLERDGDGEIMNTLEKQSVAYVNANSNLCIYVRASTADEPVSIPTGAYKVTATYVAVSAADTAFAPTTGTGTLGPIQRDGVTINITYLYKDEAGRFKHRIIVRNKTTDPVPYQFEFATAEGVDAMPGALATGQMLMPGVTVFNLFKDDLLESLEGGVEASATFVADAEQDEIDLTTFLLDPDSGAPDVVNYEPEDILDVVSEN
jgi:hypothetical protein